MAGSTDGQQSLRLRILEELRYENGSAYRTQNVQVTDTSRQRGPLRGKRRIPEDSIERLFELLDEGWIVTHAITKAGICVPTGYQLIKERYGPNWKERLNETPRTKRL